MVNIVARFVPALIGIVVLCTVLTGARVRAARSSVSCLVPQQAEFSNLHVFDPNTAQSLEKELASGTPFETLMQQMVPGTQTPQGAGPVMLSRDAIDPSVGDVIFNLAPGQASQPLKTVLGYDIFKMLSNTPARTCDAAIALAPNDPRGYYYRAQVFYKQHDLDDALADLNKVVSLGGRYAGAFAYRGAIYAQKGGFAAALADENTAIGIDPNDFMPYAERGMIEANQGDFDSADADVNRAVELGPKSAWTHYYRAYVYRRLGYDAAAIADDTAAIQADPSITAAYGDRAYMYLLSGDFTRAIADFDVQISREPGCASNICLARGLANLYAGRPAQAEADFRRDLRLWHDSYGAIWLEMAQERMHQRSSLRQDTAHLDRSAWPWPVVQLYLGASTLQSTLDAAHGDADLLCEAHFYVGVFEELHGRTKDGRRLIGLAAQNCKPPILEGVAARAELGKPH